MGCVRYGAGEGSNNFALKGNSWYNVQALTRAGSYFGRFQQRGL